MLRHRVVLLCIYKNLENKKEELRMEEKKARKIGIIFVVAVMLFFALFDGCDGGSGGSRSGGSTNKCTICGKAATHTFQGYGYCTKHYKDAIVWAMDNVNSK